MTKEYKFFFVSWRQKGKQYQEGGEVKKLIALSVYLQLGRGGCSETRMGKDKRLYLDLNEFSSTRTGEMQACMNTIGLSAAWSR